MRVLIRIFAEDDRGVTLSIEHILIATVVMLGSIVGLSGFRDTVVQEFCDLSAAASGLNHSYRITGIGFGDRIDNVETNFEIAGSAFSDTLNFCEPEDLDPGGAAPMCIEITAELTHDEGTDLP